MRSSNGFTQRLELTVRDPGLPCLVDGLIGACAVGLIVHAAGPVAWWPAILTLPAAALCWRRRLAVHRRRGPERLMLTPDERWLIQHRGGRPGAATLSRAWLAGPVCGLQFFTQDGCRWRVYLTAGSTCRDTWRRLRVRQRLPRRSP